MPTIKAVKSNAVVVTSKRTMRERLSHHGGAPPVLGNGGLRGVLAAAGNETAVHSAAFGPGDLRQARVVSSARWRLGSERAMRTLGTSPANVLIAQVLLFATLAGIVRLTGVGLSPAGWLVAVTCGAITNAALARGRACFCADRMSPADWVTLARATLAVGVAGLVADSFHRPAAVTMLVSLAAVALVLDAVDGWVARRTRTMARLGAQFDAEVDAFLILILSVYVARTVGVWVLAIGAARYAFLAAGWALPWMREPLPPRYWRKVVAATEGIVLTIAVARVLPPALEHAALGAALILLAESFGHDVWWLRSHRRAGPAPALNIAAPAPRQSRLRSTTAVALSVLALLLVWAAFVAPDHPQDLTLSAFLRVPLEGLVLIPLAIVLPRTPRRVLAGLIGMVLGLVVILKVLDIGFFTAFARPFDPVGDLGNLATGVETLRAAVGSTEANLLIVSGLALAVALLVLTTLALLRVTRVAAGNPRRSLGAVTALGAMWVLCSASGAQLLSHTPIASASTAGFVVHEVRTVQADIHDYGVFAKQINDDRFRNSPGDQLLTGLRGKDVLLTFVESYGQVTIQGSSFSPAVDAVLRSGTNTLRAAGFSARSAFLSSSTFGGISWLAHSTLQSGVWANSQRRYNQLVGTHRLTLSDAFNRAGWHSINVAPADDRPWPEGASFYHYDKLYDRRDVGYRGPGFTYAPMPDQYMFSALQRLELSKAHRPLFAEVDTVSSHMPWNRIPRMIPWNEVGNGSIFNRIPMDHETGAFWSNAARVRAAYARSVEYSLNALISFVRHYGKRNLVLVVVGDEQPLPIVSGQRATRNVPVSVIAHDPSVLKRISAWDWQSGLLPRPDAPVWRMSAFRDRFLTAYGPQPAHR